MYRTLTSYESENLSLERDAESGVCCLCVPFIDSMVRGGLRFKVTEDEFSLLASSAQARQEFADQCRQRQCDERLIEPYLPRNGKPCLPGDCEGHPFIKEYTSSRPLMIFIQQWFAVEYDFKRNQYYLGIQCDFPGAHAQGTEDYWITPEEYDHLVRHPEELIQLAGQCQLGKNDGRLIRRIQSRGWPWYTPPKSERPAQASLPPPEPPTDLPPPPTAPGFFQRLFGQRKQGG